MVLARAVARPQSRWCNRPIAQLGGSAQSIGRRGDDRGAPAPTSASDVARKGGPGRRWSLVNTSLGRAVRLGSLRRRGQQARATKEMTRGLGEPRVNARLAREGSGRGGLRARLKKKPRYRAIVPPAPEVFLKAARVGERATKFAFLYQITTSIGVELSRPRSTPASGPEQAPPSRPSPRRARRARRPARPTRSFPEIPRRGLSKVP